jgi:ribA/ribD-fused uncharacterized protein
MITREILIDRIDKGEKFEYLFFWDEPKKEVVDISCLNQWYAATFTEYEEFGTTGYYNHFPTAEHYMMYEKAAIFFDWDIAKEILDTKSPRKVQLLGRKVKNFDEEVWQKASFNIVVVGNLNKFSQNSELGNYLLATGDKVLVEASPMDTIWGIGLAKDDPKATNPKEWLGENKLGFALMEVREELRRRRDK